MSRNLTLCVKMLPTVQRDVFLFVLEDNRAEGSLLVKLKRKHFDQPLPDWLNKDTAQLAITIGEVEQ